MDASKLFLYSIFHLNLAYSSIEEEQRPEVIEKCYWPLLNLARKYNLPFGIEAPAYTLESIKEIDPSWIKELSDLITNGPCEFIGSGYSQIIGPILPAEVNAANLRLGNDAYYKLIGCLPDLAFINEQAYSSGLVKHYLDAGYKAIIMEWENSYQSHKDWNPNWRFFPQFACDQQGNRIPIIWNMSVAFQKFQRYAHGEMELSEYIEYITKQLSDSKRLFPLYGNDIEIFNFRPGRYSTEAELANNEWNRIDRLFSNLCNERWLQFIRPSDCLDFISNSHAGNYLHLESGQQPIVTKKQGKYNISRWAVTGRNDLFINTLCWKIFSHLRDKNITDEDEWRELCYLWSSDFRTHITQKRWTLFQERLHRMIGKYGLEESNSFSDNSLDNINTHKNSIIRQKYDKYVKYKTDDLEIILNTHRGLAIESLIFKNTSEKPLIRSLPHGYYPDILFSADFYSCHFVFESAGNPKITDLNKITPFIYDDKEKVAICAEITTPLGPVWKEYVINKENPEVLIKYKFFWNYLPLGSLRLGHILLNPEVFHRNSLFYCTNDGGIMREKYNLEDNNFDHGSPVSFLVSTSLGFGVTGNQIEIGDDEKVLTLTLDNTFSAPLALIKFQKIHDSYFYRLAFSIREMDETSKEIRGSDTYGYRLSFRIGVKE